MAPPISSIFCVFMSCARAIFSLISFYYLTISVLSNFVHKKKKRRDKRTELTDGEEFGRGRGADLELAFCHKLREQEENRAREAE